MISFWVAAAICLVIVLFRSAKSSKSTERDHGDGEAAEVEGGVWKKVSIFEHVERGLKKSPTGFAVAVFGQPSPELEELAGPSENHETLIGRLCSLPISPVLDGDDDLGAESRLSMENNFGLWEHPSNKLSALMLPSPPASGVYSPSSRIRSSGAIFTLTYGQLHKAALRLAVGLLNKGVRRDAICLMVIPNGAEYTILLWACILLRITYTSIDPSLLDVSGFTALKHTLRSLKPQLVVAPDAASGRSVDVAISELGLAKPIRLCLSKSRSSSTWASLAETASSVANSSIDEKRLVAAAKDDRTARIHYLLFTSGTSGRPKACPLTVGGMSYDLHSQSWLVDAESGTARFALQQAHNSRAICPLQTLQTWRAGGCVLMTQRGLRVDDVAEAICGDHDHRATFIVLSPPMVHELASEFLLWRKKAGGAMPDTSSVRRIQIGGDVVTRDILTKCSNMFPRAQVCVNHGMSEGPGMFEWPFLEKKVSEIPFLGELCPVGVAAPGALVRIWNSDKKQIVLRGQLGELQVSRGSVIKAYWAGEGGDAFLNEHQDRWFNTGDIGMIGKDGLVFILGRKKDMINRAGIVIMPAAIESSIESFTGAQTIVVAISHHVLGAEPFAVIESYKGKTGEQIKNKIRTVLGKQYSLGGIASLQQLGLDSFPVNQTHKVMKSEVLSAVQNYVNNKVS